MRAMQAISQKRRLSGSYQEDQLSEKPGPNARLSRLMRKYNKQTSRVIKAKLRVKSSVKNAELAAKVKQDFTISGRPGSI